MLLPALRGSVPLPVALERLSQLGFHFGRGRFRAGLRLLGLRVRLSWRCTGGAFPWRLSSGFVLVGGRPPALLGPGNGNVNSKVRPTARRGGACCIWTARTPPCSGSSPPLRGLLFPSPRHLRRARFTPAERGLLWLPWPRYLPTGCTPAPAGPVSLFGGSPFAYRKTPVPQKHRRFLLSRYVACPRVREGLGSDYFPSAESTLVPGLRGGASAGSIFPASTCSWYQAIHSSLSFACPSSSDCLLISSDRFLISVVFSLKYDVRLMTNL